MLVIVLGVVIVLVAGTTCSLGGIGAHTRTHTHTCARARAHTRTHTRKYILRRAISIYQKSVFYVF